MKTWYMENIVRGLETNDTCECFACQVLHHAVLFTTLSTERDAY